MSIKYTLKAIILIIIAACLLTYGFMIGQYHIFPYEQIRTVKKMATGDGENAKYQNYYYNRDSFFTQTPPNTKFDAIFLGDSLTDIGEWSELFPTSKVANRGINGDTTQGVIDRLTSISQLQPTKVFIMLGINDIMSNVPVEETYKNYTSIIEKLKSQGFDVYVQSTLLANHFNADNNKINELNNKIKDFCKAEDITFIDINSQLSKDGKLNSDLTLDGIHLNGAGYQIWKKELDNYLTD
ncbi:GDSL-type esterase/lipase family protein [Aeromonas rivipollensis]|uniref:GDSL-type esterase/lipase family protein n=1 Tax=Aeromonas rivipollensis TaxID=948519 RepID=UPI003D06119E